MFKLLYQKGQNIGFCKGEYMKQILITRGQLDRIFAEENGKLAVKYANEANDFEVGLMYTLYVTDLTDAILTRLFGEATEEDIKVAEVSAMECLNNMKENLRQLNDISIWKGKNLNEE